MNIDIELVKASLQALKVKPPEEQSEEYMKDFARIHNRALQMAVEYFGEWAEYEGRKMAQYHGEGMEKEYGEVSV